MFTYLLIRKSAVYSVIGVAFDGTNDYLTRGAGLTGASDNTQGLISFWFKFTGGDGVKQTIFNSATSDRINIFKDTDNKIYIILNQGDDTVCLNMNTTSTYTADSTWHHFCASWDMSNGLEALFVDDASDKTLTSNIAKLPDWTDTDFTMGADTAAANKLNAEIADFYLEDGSVIFPMSTVSNRRKFISTTSKPVNLGSDGSAPTGSIPIVFFHGPLDTWHTNDGNGGGFTENGTLTAAANSPSD